jgi:hypothetical protein
VAAATTLTHFFEKEGKLTRNAPVVLSFGREGTVKEVAVAGSEARAGAVLASLDEYDKIAKEISSVRDRETHYAEQLKAAEDKGSERDIKSAKAKVDEKHRKLVELEERAAKVRLVAPSAGTVSEVLVTVGSNAKPDEPAIKLVDQRMVAEFQVPPGVAGGMKAGDAVTVQAAGGLSVKAKVAAVGPAEIKVEITDDAGGKIKAGDALRLEREVVKDVVRVPLAALAKSAGGSDQVFVHTDGVARARAVTILERDAQEVVVTGGLKGGESLIVRFPPELQDGQPVSVGQ